MDIEYKGSNCIVITTKYGVTVIDPKISSVGLKDYQGKMSAQLNTQPNFGTHRDDALLIDGPGEYEISGMSVTGIAAQRHTDTPDQGKQATMYRLNNGDISIAVVGHVVPELSEAQLEAFGIVDVLIVPVGGNGYTLDAHAAVQVVRQVEPKIVIPTHYSEPGVTYEVPQAELALFIKELGATPEPTPKLKLKAGAIPEVLTVYELTRTA